MTYPTYSNWGQGTTGGYINNYALPVQPQIPQQPNNYTTGLVMVPSEDDVLGYPVAPGCSMTFITNDFLHLFIKTAGATQFEPPRIDKYNLSKEMSAKSDGEPTVTKKDSPEYALKSDLDKLWTEFKKLRNKGGDAK